MILTAEALNDKAYAVLKEGILSKQFPRGAKLVDSKLGEQYGISRTPFRDALFRLCEDGLVEKRGKSFYVKDWSQKDIFEVYEMRRMMDIYAAKLIIETILPDHPEAFDQIRLAYKKETHPDTDSTFIQDDEAFHDCIISLTRNSRLKEYYTMIRNQMRAFRNVTASNATRIEKAQDYHKRIYEAIRDRDLVAVEAAINLHVRLSLEDALKDFAE